MSKTAGSAAPKHTLIRRLFKLVLGIAAVGVLAVVALLALNAIDEDLSPEATALLAAPTMGKVEDGNGFVAFLGMAAPKDRDQMAWGRKAAAAYMAQAQPGFKRDAAWEEATRQHIYAADPKTKRARKPWCVPEERDCLAEAKRDGEALARLVADEENALLLERYRRTREAAAFADLYIGPNPAASLPGYSMLMAGASLSLGGIGLKVEAGDFDAAVAELEREVSFHRRIIAGARTIIAAMIGNRLLTRDLLTISELLRTDAARIAPYRERLAALTRPQTSAASLKEGIRFEAHTWVTLAHNVRRILRDNGGWMLSDSLADNMSPLANWLKSLLALPNQTANRVAALSATSVGIADAPAAQFDARAKEIRAASAGSAWSAEPWYARLRNPIGKEIFGDVVDLAPYAARMNDLLALERMVDLQLALAARGIGDPPAIAAHVAGEGAQSHPDPYTGKAFSFDPEKRLLYFTPRAKGGLRFDRKNGHGKAGIVL